MPKAIFFTRLPADTAALLTDQAPPEIDVQTYPMSTPEEEKAKLVADADFLILFPGHASETVIRAAKHVKLIQLVSVGFDQMDLDLCAALGIPVANNGGTNALDVAEHTIAMILAMYRRFVEMDHNVRTDNWRGIDSGSTTYTIDGKTVGLIGLGQIGQRVARLLRAFGATVIYYDAFPAKPEVEQELGVERVALEELLQQADIVSLHVPLNDSTKGLINEQSLSLMKPNAILVNTCRGPVVDEAALAVALQSGQIAGAALDVLEQEPPAADNPILQLDNVLFTPHTAGVTRDTWARRGKFIFANLLRVWAGEAPLASV
ncbi:MAG: 2-hydroxyacid dehydrogenase [Caldilineaceae bacterium]|nr:2-hydroxyacid dehydrogenase [Caldilineaceae bacterium]